MKKVDQNRSAPAPVPRQQLGRGLTPHPLDVGPQCGEVWRIITASEGAGDQVKELKLVRRTELTYSWCDPDEDPYHPVLQHVLIRDCTVVEKVDKDWQTRMHGRPVGFYDRRVSRGPQRVKPVVNWTFNADVYLEADKQRQIKQQRSKSEHEFESD